jgi:hypothetical protein
MKFFVSAAAAAALSLVATAAVCAEPVVAKLQSPVQSRVRPVTTEAVFDCTADSCTSATDNSGAQSLSTCRELVRQVGALSSFGRASKPMATDRLAACNAAVKR